MQRNRSIVIATMLALVTGSGIAVAQKAAQRGAVDANQDGVITRAEAAAKPMLAQRFDQLDKNKDGRLTADERQMRRGKGMHGGKREGRGWMQADADKDGRVSRVEAGARPQLAARFAELDVNKDGYLDRSDLQARRDARRAECFAKADTDRNGQLSKAEFERMRELCGPQGKRAPR